MISLFTVPKPFVGKIGQIQNNALTSWRATQPRAEIFLIGDEVGVAKAAKKFAARHFPQVKRSSLGTPLLDSVFKIARTHATGSVLVYVNTDIILTTSLGTVLTKINFPDFLLAGRRYDLPTKVVIDPQNKAWLADLWRVIKKTGRRHHPAGSDYFVFPKQSRLAKIPPFVVGRPGWDNWFIYHARSQNIPVVDLSWSFPIIHQNHDYGHVPKQRGTAWEGPEGDQNRALIGDLDKIFDLWDVSHLLTPFGVVPAVTPKHLQRRLARWRKEREKR